MVSALISLERKGVAFSQFANDLFTSPTETELWREKQYSPGISRELDLFRHEEQAIVEVPEAFLQQFRELPERQ